MTGGNSASLDYHFVDEWRLAADVTDVVAVVRDVTGWPTWWPSVRSVEVVEAGADRGQSWRFCFATRLPYRMVFVATLVRDDPNQGVETSISGQVEGSGCWLVEGVGGGALVRFDWRVQPRWRWMRMLSPVARPIYNWNHRALLTEGGQALAAHLHTRLLAPVVSRLD